MSGPPTTGLATGVVFNDTWSTAVDAAGNVYVADYSGDVVDKISPSGYLSIIAGQSQQFGLPTAGPATATTLKTPTSIAVDSAGDVYFTDYNACEVDEINPAGHLSIIAGDGTCATTTAGPATNAIRNPYGIAINPSGTIYFTDQNDDEVWKIDSGTLVRVAGTGSPGAPIAGAATSSPLNWPQSIAFDTAGDLYVADNTNSDVEKITPAGVLSVIAGTGSAGSPLPGPATSSPLSYPAGVAVNSAGDVFVSDTNNSVVEEITPDGNLSIVAGQAGTGANPVFGGEALSSTLNYPVGLSVGPNGVLYVGDDGAATVDALVPDPPAASVPPTVSGTPAVGQTVSATTGSWSNQPLSYSYQWRDCDSSGGACTPITGATGPTVALTSADVGHTIRVAVTGTNASGQATAVSAQVGPVTAIPAPTPAPGSNPTTGVTSPTTPSTPASDDGVAVSAEAASAGLAVSAGGTVALPLQCPQTVSGCDADGDLALALTRPHAHAIAADAAAAPIHSSVIARFAGIEIQAGHGRLVSVRLSPAATRYLQTRGIRRVRVTLTIDNHLLGGTPVVTVQRLWLRIAPLLNACPAASGQLTASRIGTMKLGLTRRQAHRLGRHRRAGRGYERYCLTGGKIRVAYPISSLARHLDARTRRDDAGRVIFALTANRHYQIHGVRVRMTVSAAQARMHLGRGVVIGLNTWYIINDRKANWVLKAQHGIVREIGITQRSLTHTRAQRDYLLHHL